MSLILNNTKPLPSIIPDNFWKTETSGLTGNDLIIAEQANAAKQIAFGFVIPILFLVLQAIVLIFLVVNAIKFVKEQDAEKKNKLKKWLITTSVVATMIIPAMLFFCALPKIGAGFTSLFPKGQV